MVESIGVYGGVASKYGFVAAQGVTVHERGQVKKATVKKEKLCGLGDAKLWTHCWRTGVLPLAASTRQGALTSLCLP